MIPSQRKKGQSGRFLVGERCSEVDSRRERVFLHREELELRSLERLMYLEIKHEQLSAVVQGIQVGGLWGQI